MSRRVPKPWGHELISAETDRSVGIITQNLRYRTSAAGDCDDREATTPELEDVRPEHRDGCVALT
ncbi:hypothetical protein K2Z84_22555 [Candidatus Binatia bacterium]|nr:hypothetical protein [Candidatus Binatia bacterium]